MGSYSKSANEHHYKNGHHGSGHYQKKGLLGNLRNLIDSRSGSGGHHNYYGNNHEHPMPMNNPTRENPKFSLCKQCNAQIPEGSKFCLHCGAKVVEALFCPHCGEKLPSNANFCLQCGGKLNG